MIANPSPEIEFLLRPSRRRCPECGMALPEGPFDRLTPAQEQFVLYFLRSRGNLSAIPEGEQKLESVLHALEGRL